jgi:pimeloyl-ACP methyl ester carboxylesterase
MFLLDRRQVVMTIAANTIAAAGLAPLTAARARVTATTDERSDDTFVALRQIDAGLLNVGYLDVGRKEAPVVLLLHGWPYDIHSYGEVAPLLASRGCRVIVPYLRGYGTTRFLSDATLRTGRPVAVAADILSLMNALNVEEAIIGGFGWGAQAANIIAALWPERVRAMVSVGGYLIGDRDKDQTTPATDELKWWQRFYFVNERGQEAYGTYHQELSRVMWQLASPEWKFDEATFNRSASALNNADHVAIVVHNFKSQLGLIGGDPRYDELEKHLEMLPAISVPTISIEGDVDGAPRSAPSTYASKFIGGYEHRSTTGGIGHNLPQEAPLAFAKAVIDLATDVLV